MNGDTFATEKDSLHITASAPRQVTVNGILKLEEAVTELPESVILRYGTLYGPGNMVCGKRINSKSSS